MTSNEELNDLTDNLFHNNSLLADQISAVYYESRPVE